MPDMKRTDVGEAELCNACAFIRTGNQQCKTAVVTGNNSAYWEEEFDLEYESEDEVIAEILHCDQVGSDISLGSAHIPIAELFSSHAAELCSGEVVERSISLEAKPSHPLTGTDGQPSLLKLGITIPANRASYVPPSDSDEELPRSELQDPPASPSQALRDAAAALSPAHPPAAPSATGRDAAQPAPPQGPPSPGPRDGRGGVGIKFKVCPPPTCRRRGAAGHRVYG